MAGTRNFSSPNHPEALEVHPSSCSTDTWGSFPRVKAARP